MYDGESVRRERDDYLFDSPRPHAEEHRASDYLGVNSAMRLEGWAQGRARCPPFETAASRPPQGEVISSQPKAL
jgi:hypothetical protein